MASNQKASRPSGPPKSDGWTEVGPRGKPKKRSPAVSTVTPSPALRSSPRKDSPSATLSKPVTHTAPLKPVLSAPRTSTVSKPPPSKELSPPLSSPSKPLPVSTEKAVVRSDSVSSPPPSLPLSTPPKVVAKPPPTTVETVVARRYPLGFKSEKEFRDLTRPIAQQARDGIVFVSGSSVTGKSFATGKAFGSHSDIDVGIASRRLREDSTQVQQSGPGRAFPVRDSSLDTARGRTKDRHPIGAKVFYGVPGERQVLVREHTPEGKRIK